MFYNIAYKILPTYVRNYSTALPKVLIQTEDTKT